VVWWYGRAGGPRCYAVVLHSSCVPVLVREEGVNGLLGIVYGDSGGKVVHFSDAN
jgi:hypothetical protein